MKLPNVERRLQITLATLVALGTCLLGMGQRDVKLPLVALVASATSVYFTDIRGWLKLNHVVANLAALAAVGLSVKDFFEFGSGLQLLAIANLLIYLQVILLYQQKNTRLYWQIMLLSLLQVVVGAALNLGLSFGVLLLIYMLLALLAMHLMFIRLTLRHEAQVLSLDPSRQFTPLGEFESASPAEHAAVPPPSDQPRRPVTPGREILRLAGGRLLARNVSLLTLATLAVTTLTFMVIPRTGRAVWQPSGLGFARTVGFSQSVELGAMGEISGNPEEVLRVKFFRPDSREPFQLAGEPLLRGTLLTRYTAGRWRHPLGSVNAMANEQFTDEDDIVMQQVTIEPMDHTVLFSVYPPVAVVGGDLRRDAQVRLPIERSRYMRRQRMDYLYGTTGIRNGAMRTILPNVEKMTDLDQSLLLQMPDPDEDGYDRLSGLRKLADQWIAEAGVQPGNLAGKARVLTRKLQAPPFEYTLSGPSRNPELDPVEDFVTLHRSGHCEYFASALCLMLRSQNIPARIVVGYRGGEWNSIGGFYQVRQLHAHTWVEAYLDNRHVPANEPGDFMLGGWLVLDATPAAADFDLAARNPILAAVGEMTEYLKMIWATYVVGLNAERQSETIYQPFTQRVRETIESWLDPAKVGALAGSLGIVGPDDDLNEWGVWVGKLALLLILAGSCTVFIVQYAVRSLLRRVLGGPISPKGGSRARSREVEFYDRFEKLLARHGMIRSESQTQYEFALAVSGQLAERPEQRVAAALPRRIAEIFYRVRFGGQTLDQRSAGEVETALAQLTGLLAAQRAKTRRWPLTPWEKKSRHT